MIYLLTEPLHINLDHLTEPSSQVRRRRKQKDQSESGEDRDEKRQEDSTADRTPEYVIQQGILNWTTVICVYNIVFVLAILYGWSLLNVAPWFLWLLAQSFVF